MHSLFSLLGAAAISGWLAIAGCQSAALTSAKIYLQEGQPERAKEQLHKALESTPDNPEVHLLLGRIYASEGDYPAMAAALRQSLELSSQFGEEIAELRRYHWAREYNRGIELATAEAPDYSGAREAFAQATLIDPQEIPAWRNLAFTYYQLDQFELAIQTYQQLAGLAPEDTTVYAHLGALCLQQDRPEEAVEAFSRLVELNPTDARAFVNLGIAHEQQDQPVAAQAAYLRAVELHPGLPMAHYGLGNFYWNSGAFEAARDEYLQAVELDPENADVRFNLAMTYLMLEDDGAALPLLERLSEEMPENGAVWRQLSAIYARQDRVTQSLEANARAEALGH